MESTIPVKGPDGTYSFQLSELSQFVLAVAFHNSMFGRIGDGFGTIPIGGLYCPACGGERRMFVTPIDWPFKDKPVPQSFAHLRDALLIGSDEESESDQAEAAQRCVPSLFSLACVQCSTKFTALIYAGPDGPSLAVLPSCRGGLATPHTPTGVAFYLNQAQRAQSLGANSAAVAMFRGALEHLLYEQGYEDGMCGKS